MEEMTEYAKHGSFIEDILQDIGIKYLACEEYGADYCYLFYGLGVRLVIINNTAMIVDDTVYRECDITFEDKQSFKQSLANLMAPIFAEKVCGNIGWFNRLPEANSTCKVQIRKGTRELYKQRLQHVKDIIEKEIEEIDNQFINHYGLN